MDVRTFDNRGLTHLTRGGLHSLFFPQHRAHEVPGARAQRVGRTWDPRGPREGQELCTAHGGRHRQALGVAPMPRSVACAHTIHHTACTTHHAPRTTQIPSTATYSRPAVLLLLTDGLWCNTPRVLCSVQDHHHGRVRLDDQRRTIRVAVSPNTGVLSHLLGCTLPAHVPSRAQADP